MRLALLSSDDREVRKSYGDKQPILSIPQVALLQGLEKYPDWEVHYISCLQQPVNAPEKLGNNIWYHALQVPKIGWMRTGYSGCIRAVRRKLREIQPDIVHGEGTDRDCAICAVYSGFPNVITIHGNMRAVARGNHAPPFSFAWLAARLEAFTVPRTAGVVCCTTYTLKEVEGLARKTWLVPNAVCASFFEIKRFPTLPSRILCVGTILPLKNQNELIRALDNFQAPNKFELIFLGAAHSDSAYTREFFDLVAARPWCRHEGLVSREGLKKQLAAATGLIHPSLEDNCPMVILEAMAAGVPVAASRIGGIPDLIRHGETGMLFDPMEKGAMAGAMQSLLANAEPETAVRARSEALTRFHPDHIAQRHVEIYREVLSSSPI